MLIDNNNVSAHDQMLHSPVVSFLGDSGASKRILAVGNSITRHAPKADIGWRGDWGMAASAPEKDYVHRLFALLEKDGQDVFMRIRQSAEWEVNLRSENILDDYDGERAFRADIVVFRLGENVAGENKPYFKEKLREFVSHICPCGKVIFTTCFWENPVIDQAIAEVAGDRGEICIDCGFSRDEKNMALGQFAHTGVAHHPSDAGMEEIARAIFACLKNDNMQNVRG